MNKVSVLISILFVILVNCTPQKEHPINRISKEEYDSLMLLEYEAFDQTSNGGWRRYSDDVELQIQLVQDYIQLHRSTQQSLRWHLGQLYGMNDDYESAIEQFEQCLSYNPEDDVYKAAWNYYVNATIAFMKRDRNLFNAYFDSLQNHNETMNIHVLIRLKENFDKSYREAY